MDERFLVRDFLNAVTGRRTYRVIDMLDQGNPENLHVFEDVSAAEAARALLSKRQLNLNEGWNRSLLRLQNALSTDSDGMEIFVGLDRAESEIFAEGGSEPTDELIDLTHRHREARTGYKVDPV